VISKEAVTANKLLMESAVVFCLNSAVLLLNTFRVVVEISWLLFLLFTEAFLKLNLTEVFFLPFIGRLA
jgi:hypothetical protein